MFGCVFNSLCRVIPDPENVLYEIDFGRTISPNAWNFSLSFLSYSAYKECGSLEVYNHDS